MNNFGVLNIDGVILIEIKKMYEMLEIGLVKKKHQKSSKNFANISLNIFTLFYVSNSARKNYVAF